MRAKDGLKICSSCKENKEVSAFNKHHATVDNLQNACKVCKAKLTKNWKYAIKTGHFDEMVKSQKHCCAICNQLTEELVIDHCHKSGVIRQLLCRKCNSLLGMCNDNVLILNSAIAYIKKWTEE